jgi:hypothetical protein
MATTIVYNSVSYTIPSIVGESNWGTDLTAYLVALSTGGIPPSISKQTIRVVVTTPVAVQNATDYAIVCKMTSPSAVAVNLPAGATGRLFAIVDGTGDASTNNITINGNGGEQINGSSSYVIDADHGGVIVGWNSTGWNVIADFVGKDPSFDTITVGTITATTLSGATLSGTTIAAGSNSITGLTNGNLSGTAGIIDANLATISTAGKVANSATTAASTNTNSAIVARDGSGNFSAGTITANLTGNASGTAANITGVAAVANGGTGLSALGTALQVLRVNAGATALEYGSVSGFVTDVSATLPLSSSGGTTPDISIALADTSTDGYISSTDWNTFNNKIGPTLTSGNLLIGNGSNVATSVAMTGDISISNAGVTSIASGVIVNADVSASAAIAYSKLNLSTSILNADINASAAIALSKLAATTASRALVSDGSGFISASSVTATELGYVSGVTSAIQTQITAKLTDPMTTRGDTLYRNASNITARLPIGASGYVLTSDGTDVSWAAATGGFANPMTTGGDIIYGGASGVATRLANGSSGQVLTSSGSTSAPTWATPTVYANTALSNLSAVAINTDLVFATALALKTVQTSNETGSTDSTDIAFGSGEVDTGLSGRCYLYTGFVASGTQASGDIFINSGGVEGTADSGSISINSGYTDNAAGGSSGAVTVRTGTVFDAGIKSGNTYILSGEHQGAGETGVVFVESGEQSGSGNSGPVYIGSGIVNDGSSGDVEIATAYGNGGNSGNISLIINGADVTQGKIYFVDGSEGTAGHVWTSQGTNGEGAWAAPVVPTPAVTAVSSNVTLTASTIHLVDCSAARSLTLPTPSSGLQLVIKDSTGQSNTNNITVVRAGSEQIEGVAASKVLQTDWGAWTFVSNGTDWFMV